MGLFSFVKSAGEKMLGNHVLDDLEIRRHVLAQGVELNPFTVVADNETGKVTLIGYAKIVEDKEKAIVAAGNIKGVETVEDRLKIGAPDWLAKKQVAEAAAASEPEEAPDDMPEPSEDDAPQGQFYTVKSGDTLSKIARETLGSANQYPAIFEANKPMLKHPDKIYPGQVLRIPSL